MAVAKLNKLFIISHKSDTETVLKKLQKIPITVEVKPHTDKIDLEIPVSDTSPEYITRVKRALDILNDSKDEKLKKITSRTGKLVIRRSEYEKILESTNFKEIVDNILDIEDEMDRLDAEVTDMEPRTRQLNVWSCYRGNLEDIADGDIYTIKLGIIKCEENDFEEIVKNLDENKISCEKLSEDRNVTYVILAYHNQYKKGAEEYLGSISFEEAEITGYKGTTSENLNKIKKSINLNRNRKKYLQAEIRKISRQYEKPLTVFLDYIENNLEIEEAIESGFSTDSVSFHTAWVKETDKKKIISAVESFKSTRVIEIQPDEDENVPVILENKPLFRPFEIVVDLYGVPRYFEIDPTPFVALFFAMFFGLCLTDAGYGFIIAILALIFAFRIRNIKKFLMMIFIGAIFAIFAGAIFNGWFGDLPAYLGIDGFFSKLAILGDPINSKEGPMNFFRLALILGVIHVVFGLFIKFFDCLRRKDWGGSFLDGLPWIIIILSLIAILLSSRMAVSMQLVTGPLFPASISKILLWPILAGAVVIIFFGARDEKSWGLRIFMGFLNLTIVNGLTSFLGDFLSYIRLMALGMVTAGIGIAVNKIAFQFLSIPVAGIIILIIILIFGHIFNIGVSILGGFVHTLRLQYVEFFPKFYVGGGRPFEALKDEHKYITIVD
ncbi:MAG: V-type ATP synthase subunit I [Actinobacteria bacterium]|nr:V-type ATP synthase subunit I [Actinomycetota bacterium]MBL7123440.1 V-type ATP synthase subunit I [Actinomycetota bacterium]